MTLALNNHIVVDDLGIAYVSDTSCKVREIAVLKLAWGLDPEQIHRQLPHLSLAQIHSALAYYYDHQTIIDQEIARDLNFADKAAMSAATPSRQHLEARRA